MLSKNALQALRFIRNFLVHRGFTPSVREIMENLNYDSPNSAVYIIEQLIDAGYLKKRPNGKLKLIKELRETTTHAQTIKVPLVGSVSCGKPFFAEENIEALISISTQLARPSHKHFLLRAVGDSMNKKDINDGDLVLVRQQPTADNGQIVVALIDDEATMKEFYQTDDVILLKPQSRNKKHKPIILKENFKIQGVVINKIPNF